MANKKKFGEFDSVEELNAAAEGLMKEGDLDGLLALANENGLDKEDAMDYFDGYTETLATLIQAASAKLKYEAERLELKGQLLDWKNMVVEKCINSHEFCKQVMKKDKHLSIMLGGILKFSFENKIAVHEDIVKSAKLSISGSISMGMAGKQDVERIITEYYQVEV